MERTYIMLKPDVVERKLTGRIIERIGSKGYRIIEIKVMNLKFETPKQQLIFC